MKDFGLYIARLIKPCNEREFGFLKNKTPTRTMTETQTETMGSDSQIPRTRYNASDLKSPTRVESGLRASFRNNTKEISRSSLSTKQKIRGKPIESAVASFNEISRFLQD